MSGDHMFGHKPLNTCTARPVYIHIYTNKLKLDAAEIDKMCCSIYTGKLLFC